MSMRFTIAVVSAALLAGAAGIAYAQGSITQDPGSLAPRNLTLQYLGPSGAGVTIPGEPGYRRQPAVTLAERARCGRYAARLRQQRHRRRQGWWWVLDQPARRQPVSQRRLRLNPPCSAAPCG